MNLNYHKNGFGQKQHCPSLLLLTSLIRSIWLFITMISIVSGKRRLNINTFNNADDNHGSSTFDTNKSTIFIANENHPYKSDFPMYKDNFFFKRQIIVLLIPPNYGMLTIH